jgi:hypothetical protein
LFSEEIKSRGIGDGSDITVVELKKKGVSATIENTGMRYIGRAQANTAYRKIDDTNVF